jgi:hypothetical protein
MGLRRRCIRAAVLQQGPPALPAAGAAAGAGGRADDRVP